MAVLAGNRHLSRQHPAESGVELKEPYFQFKIKIKSSLSSLGLTYTNIAITVLKGFHTLGEFAKCVPFFFKGNTNENAEQMYFISYRTQVNM